jgi:hypothetical protein
MTVGMAEVRQKRAAWAAMRAKERKHFLDRHWLPAILGPTQAAFIVDHHHLGLALLEEGVKSVSMVILKDLSHLELPEFWHVMEHHQWAHPFDSAGHRQPFKRMPSQLVDLKDDPYRSLAAQVREQGGYAKDTAPFAEFLWADFFRLRIHASLLRKNPAQATLQALAMCHEPQASHLPGWSGIGS